jgi:hypothetical protein
LTAVHWFLRPLLLIFFGSWLMRSFRLLALILDVVLFFVAVVLAPLTVPTKGACSSIAVIGGYLAILVGRSVLVHLTHPWRSFERTRIRVTEVSTRPRPALPERKRDVDRR